MSVFHTLSLITLLLLATQPGVLAQVTTMDPLSLHAQVLTIDSHIDIPVSLGIDPDDPGRDGPMQVDFPKMRAAGLDAGFFIVYVAQSELTDAGYEQAYQQALEKFAAIERTLQRYPEQVALATTPGQLRSSQEQQGELRRGYTPEQIKQICSGNLLRVWSQVVTQSQR